MFEIDSERTTLPLSPDRVLALVASLNAPMVVAADMPVEPTRAYICAYRDNADQVGFSIYLHCVESNKGTFYRYDGGAVPRARFDDVMSEAMAFAESLGFMMDDLGWERLDGRRRDELVRETPMFLEPSARAKVAAGMEGSPNPVAELTVDEAADAGVVGATPISPILEPAAPVTASAPPSAPSPSPARAEVDTAPRVLETVFVPPPVAPSGLPRARARSPAPPQASAPPRPAPIVPPPESGVREIELPEAEPVAPPPPRVEARPAAPVPPRPAPRAAAPAPGAGAAAQALVRLLASL